MLIALLVVLGVDLIVVVALVVGLIARRRWLARHGAFSGRVRVTQGAVDGLGSKWKHGKGRWVRDVLVFSPGPLLLASRVVPIDGVSGEPRPATEDEGKRLGDGAIVAGLVADDATVELAAPAGTPLPAF